MPMFSVVTPAYNAEAYLAECVASVAAQAYDDWEMIIVDDGSTDGTADLAAGLAKSEVRIRLVSKGNGGVSSARNAGLGVARGRYIIFLDSDDEMHPSAMAAYAAAISSGNPDVVQGVALRVDASGDGVSRIAVSSQMSLADSAEGAVGALALADKAPLLHYVWNKAYKRGLLETVQARFDESVSLGEDFLFNCRVLASTGPVVFIDADVCRYIQRTPASLTRRFRPDELSRRRKMESAFRALLETFGQWEAKRSLYERSVGLIALESARSVALPGCGLTGPQKCTFVRSFYGSEYRGYVGAYVASDECARADRLLGRAFLTGRIGLFVVVCSLVQKLKGPI